MRESTEEQVTTNVIEVQFKPRQEEIPEDIAHPASRYFDEELDDDPLMDLLHEFDDALAEQDDEEVQEDFIFHLLKTEDVHLQMSQKATEMGIQVLDQVNRLKEDVKRMKFYLDEMNIDD